MLDAQAVAARAGVDLDDVVHLVDLGILAEDDDRGFSDADVRRVRVVQALEQAGVAIEDVAKLIRSGQFSLAFLDRAGRDVFAAMSSETFAEVSDRTGVPISTLGVIREATGGQPPAPTDRIREDELRIVPLVERQHALGFRRPAIGRAIRVYGESLRRIAEAEAEWWRSEVQEPLLATGASSDDVTSRSAEISPQLSRDSTEALVAMYHAQQMQVWMSNLVEGITTALERSGLHERETTTPAIAFLDLTGYTELTHTQGDQAAARVIEQLNQIVARLARKHGGRPIKWLGDGVMLHFPTPAGGVAAAVEMVEALAAAGLPPAHVGLHAGHVVIQQGDYYGETVNVAARVGEFARPGEVLVTQAVVDALQTAPFEFVAIGPVELKGLVEPLALHAVRPASLR